MQLPFEVVSWGDDETVVLLDQTRLPDDETYLRCATVDDVIAAIRRLSVRGAPAIGVAGGYGAALAARIAAREALAARGAERVAAGDTASDPSSWRSVLDPELARLRAARPTAVNLAWAIDQVSALLDRLRDHPVEAQCEAVLVKARRLHAEDAGFCDAIGRHGAELIPDGATVLTHCNAGALATAGIGTAISVVYSAVAAGKKVQVFADETRPLLQGARLTAWECRKMGVPVTVLCDNAAGSVLARGMVDRIVVGSDRIAANGDVANKIGTYPLAVLAREHGVPFYVAAPTSTVDLATPTGAGIPIEERAPEEVTTPRGLRITPPGVPALNPAFDVTPHALVAAIITEKGVALPPYGEALRRMVQE